MKRIYTTPEYKKRNTKRAKDRLKQTLLSKVKAKTKRKKLMGIPIVLQREQRDNNRFESLKGVQKRFVPPIILDTQGCSS